MFWAEILKKINIFIWNLSVFGGEIFNILNRRVFVMDSVVVWKTCFLNKPSVLKVASASDRADIQYNSDIDLVI